MVAKRRSHLEFAMFEVDKPALIPAPKVVDGTIGLACPHASELPHSLMDEYQALLSSSKSFSLKQTFKSDALDIYEVENNAVNNLRTIEVTHSDSPSNQRAVYSLADKTGHSDHFQNGMRIESDFQNNQTTDKTMVIVAATISHDGGAEHITQEYGWVTDRSTLKQMGYFDASFDASGKVTSYVAGPNADSASDRIKDCSTD
jgi:hypothetical protein